MKRWRGWVAGLMILASGGAIAHEAHEANGLYFDCWIGNVTGPETTHFIRCIVDRDLSPADAGEVEDRFDTLLDLIHGQLHSGAIADAENTLRVNSSVLREGAFWSIFLYSYPSEWSWDEALPEKLVEAALCPRGRACRVMIFRR